MKKTVIVAVAAFVSGALMGANRPILKLLSPATNNGSDKIARTCNAMLTFIVRRKEHIQDLVAEAKMSNHEDREEDTIALS